jgi:hypothetical protein
MLSPVQEKRQNLFRLKLISNSKRSNFENRTEWMEFYGMSKSALRPGSGPPLTVRF